MNSVKELLIIIPKLERAQRHIKSIDRLLDETFESSLRPGLLPSLVSDLSNAVNKKLAQYKSELNEARDALKEVTNE